MWYCFDELIQGDVLSHPPTTHSPTLLCPVETLPGLRCVAWYLESRCIGLFLVFGTVSQRIYAEVELERFNSAAFLGLGIALSVEVHVQARGACCSTCLFPLDQRLVPRT